MLHSLAASVILSCQRIVGHADGNASGYCMYPAIHHGDLYSVKKIRGKIRRESIVLVIFDRQWLPANDNRKIDYIIKRVKYVKVSRSYSIDYCLSCFII